MKKIILWCCGSLFVSSLTYAQVSDTSSTPDNQMVSLWQKVTQLKKKTDAFHLYLNMQGSFNAYLHNDAETKAAFRMNQLRIEAKGQITDRIYYRYRQRLNRSNQAQTLDNLPSSIDYAAVGFRITPRFSILAGKQCTAFGGFEFDLNPIEVYQYCDMIEYMSNFLTGVDFSYRLNEKNDFHFQVVDSRNGSFQDMYGKVAAGVEAAEVPLGYTLNWNGSLWENRLKTRWSASIFHEAQKKNWYYYALGTELNLNRFLGFLDFMYSKEDLDRTGLITEITATDGYDTRAMDCRYLSLVLHLNYRIFPKWNLFVKGMYETASVEKQTELLEKGKYRTAWGYLGGIEYYPMKQNLHFFLNYIGRSYEYTDKAKVFGVGNSHPQRIELGLVYQLPLF